LPLHSVDDRNEQGVVNYDIAAAFEKIAPQRGRYEHEKTFGSILAQNRISTAVTQKLLEHSSPNLTNKVYMNVDSVLRHAVEQLPVGGWL